jgi:hypothetical protein
MTGPQAAFLDSGDLALSEGNPLLDSIGRELLQILHLLRESGREGAWMLGFPVRALGRVHVWVHRN